MEAIVPSTNILLTSVYEWQTLITGVFAALAAFLTVAGIRDQIENENRRARAERAKRAASFRALLPHVLSDICDLIEVDNAKLKTSLATGAPPAPLDWPTTITGHWEVIRSVMEFEDDSLDHPSRLRTLVSQLQIYRARRRDRAAPRGRASSIEIMDRIRDAAEIHISASSLFDYARGADHRQKSSRDRVLETLRILDYWEGIDVEVFEYFDRRYPV